MSRTLARTVALVTMSVERLNVCVRQDTRGRIVKVCIPGGDKLYEINFIVRSKAPQNSTVKNLFSLVKVTNPVTV